MDAVTSTYKSGSREPKPRGPRSRSRPFNLYNTIGVILFFGLFYGMYKKSRICAIMLLLFSIIHNIYFIIIGITPLGIIIDLLITFFFAYCVYGTFVYHKIINFKLNE